MRRWQVPEVPEDPTGDYTFVPFIITLYGVVFDGPGVQPRDRLEDLAADLQTKHGPEIEFERCRIECDPEDEYDGAEDAEWLRQLEREGLIPDEEEPPDDEEPPAEDLSAENYYYRQSWDE